MFQLEIWKNVLEDHKTPYDSKLILIGTVRGPDDQEIVDNLKQKAKDLKMDV
jgi:hypothetical protein